jgi:hypothetical protein
MGKKGAGISMANKGPAVQESVVLPEQTQEIKEAAPKKRNPCPGVRLIGKRIYDPENGKTCHQVSTCHRPSPPFWICKCLCAVGHSVGADLVDSLSFLLPARSVVRKQRTSRYLANSRRRRVSVQSTSATSAFSTG